MSAASESPRSNSSSGTVPAGRGPLAGLRVVEMAAQGPVPYCGMLLADLGADVIRVDRPGSPTLVTLPNPVIDRGRRSMVVDLKHPRAAEVVLRLVETSDLFMEGLRPGVMERLGIGPQECLQRNPRLVYGRLTGWGQTGPWSRKAGHDINYIGLTGALHAIGDQAAPVVPLNLLGDYAGGSMFLMLGMLSALLSSRTTGAGQVVDAAMVDGATSLMSMTYGLLGVGRWTDQRAANLLDGGAPFYAVYRCADGESVAVGALEDPFYEQLLSGLGLADRADLRDGRLDPASWPRLRSVFEERFLQRTRAQWGEIFDGTDACVTPVLSLVEAAQHPQNVARGLFEDSGGLHRPAPAPRFHAADATSAGSAHDIDGASAEGRADQIAPKGQDTVRLLRESGWSEEEVADLIVAGCVAASDQPE